MRLGYVFCNFRKCSWVIIGFLKKLPAVHTCVGSGSLDCLSATISVTACLSMVVSFTLHKAKITEVMNALSLSSCLKILSR